MTFAHTKSWECDGDAGDEETEYITDYQFSMQFGVQFGDTEINDENAAQWNDWNDPESDEVGPVSVMNQND